MGNCFAKKVDHNISPGATKPSSPVTKGRGIKKVGTPSEKSRSNSSEKKKTQTVGVDTPAVAPPSTSVPKQQMIAPNLKMFSFQELKSATKNFKPDTILGEGGFGKVFKGWIDETTLAPSRVGVGIAVAVKKSSPDTPLGLEQWQSEVKFLGRFTHPNLVKLIGYCWEDRQYLLVYEHMQKGSLENHLFRNTAEPLTWDIRLKIAIDAGRGLAFLHTSEKTVIYRDFKASNILLDGDYNAKLSDFGLAKHGPVNGDSHLTTRILGTFGYAAPEYIATGHLYVLSDVYGFGVVLLEMLTGLRAYDDNRPKDQHNLVDWAKPMLTNKRKVIKIMDPRLDRQYSPKGAFQAAQLVIRCLESDPKKRPTMDEVLVELEQVKAMTDRPKDSKPKDKQRNKVESRKQTSQQPQHTRQDHNNIHNHRGNRHNGHVGTSSNGARARK